MVNNMTVKSTFDAYSNYYDLFYSEKSYAEEVRYVDDVLQKHGVNCPASLLEFGSGTGGHAKHLISKGHHITGIELSSKMIEKASKNLTENFTCHQGDIRFVNLNRKFDAVISLFHVMSYQVSNEDVESVFRRAGEHLFEGGLFVFDAWYGPAVHTQKPEVRVKRITNKKIEALRIAEPTIHSDKNRVDVDYTIFIRELSDKHFTEINETHAMRHFSVLEIDLFAKNTGFTLVASEEFLTGSPLDSHTWGACFVLKKGNHDE